MPYLSSIMNILKNRVCMLLYTRVCVYDGLLRNGPRLGKHEWNTLSPNEMRELIFHEREREG